MPRILSINPIGIPQSYAVTDATQTVMVGLRDFAWNGSCTCDTFQTVCMFMLQSNPKKRQRCDHILASRQWMLEHEVPALMENNIVVMPNYEAAVGIVS